MKYTLLFVSFIVFIINSNGQDSTIRLSKFEQFSRLPGSLMKTEINEIGTISGVSIARVKTINLTSKSEASAIKLYPNKRVSLSTVNSQVVYIELEDIDSIINALTYYSKEAQEVRPVNDQYYSYITSNDLEVACFYSTSGFGFWEFSIGRVYSTLRSRVPASSYTFNKARIAELIDLLHRAKTATAL